MSFKIVLFGGYVFVLPPLILVMLPAFRKDVFGILVLE